METNSHQTRNSISFTPQLMKRSGLESRRSLSSLNLDGSERTTNDTLFDTLMKDPAKRTLILQVLSQERENIERYKQKENKKKTIKLKQIKNTERLLHCESPTALLRRRALKKHRDSDSSSSTSDSKSIPSSPVPFERLLRGVVAYVEIRSKEGDRSAGAKALMQAMGATVKDGFTSEVTHVVFKDGSFNTYQKAKLMKVYLVSVLWLEAVRKNNFRVPEKNYPALGTESFDVNISLICQDYEKVVNEELRRSVAVGLSSSACDKSIKSRKTALPSELKTVQEHTVLPFCIPGARLSDVFVPTSQDWEAQSVISCQSGTLPFKRTIGTVQEEEHSDKLGDSTPELTSDDDSDCGVINGHSFKRDSILSDLDVELIENTAEKNQIGPAVNTAALLEPSRINASTNTTANTSSSRSVSLLSRKSSAYRKSSYDNVKLVDMDMTRNLVETDFDKENSKSKPRESGSLSKKNKRDSGLLSNSSTNLLDEIPGTNLRPSRNRSNKASSSNSNKRSTHKNSYSCSSPGGDKMFKKPSVNSADNLRKYHSSEDILTRMSSDSTSLKRSTRSTDDLTGRRQTQKKASVNSNEMSPLRISASSNDTLEKMKSSNPVHTSSKKVEPTYSNHSDLMSPLQISVSISSYDASEQNEEEHHKTEKDIKIHNYGQNSNQEVNNEEMPSLRTTRNSLNDTLGQTEKNNLRSSSETAEAQTGQKDKSLGSSAMSSLRISHSSSDVSQNKNQISLESNSRHATGELQVIETEDKSFTILTDELLKKKKGSKPLPETITLQNDENDTNSWRETRSKSSKHVTQIPDKNEKQIGRSRSLKREQVNLPLRLSDVEKEKNWKASKSSPEIIQTRKLSRDDDSEDKNKKVLKSCNNRRSERFKNENVLNDLSNGHKNLEQNNDAHIVLKVRTRKSARTSNKNHANNKNELTGNSLKSLDCFKRNSRSRSKTETPHLKLGVTVSDVTNFSLTSNNHSLHDQSEDNSTTSTCDSPQNKGTQNEENTSDNKQKLKSEERGKEKGENKVFRKLYNLNQSVEEALKNFEWTSNAQTNDDFSSAIVTKSVTTVSYVVPKQISVVPLIPISVTPAAKKLLENIKKKKPVAKKKKVTKENTILQPSKRVYLNSSKDEQKELADEYVNKSSKRKLDVEEESPGKKRAIQISRRRSQRISQSEKLCYKENSSQSETIDENHILPDLNRRSTFEFVEKSAKRQKKTKKKNKKKKCSIVCTRLHKPEVQTFMQIVKKLGGFFVEDEVSDHTTHLLVGEPKRTINLLKAVARGCWILKHEWLFRSLEAEKWLSEEDFEVTEFSPSVQQCRLERQAFGPYYSMDIFANCGPIYIARNSIPRHTDLEELVRLCKGTITDIAYNASIVVGDWVRYDNVTCVTAMWVLDSITFKKCKSFKKYYYKRDI